MAACSSAVAIILPARPEPPREQASPGVAAGVFPALPLIVSLSWPGQFLMRHTVHASPEPAPAFLAGEPVPQKRLPPWPGGEPVT